MGKEFMIRMEYRIDENTATIWIRGELDHHSMQKISMEIRQIIDAYMPRTMILDFHDLRFMDSSGLALVIGCSRYLSELNGHVILRNVPPQQMKVFAAAGISRFVTVENTEKVVSQ